MSLWSFAVIVGSALSLQAACGSDSPGADAAADATADGAADAAADATADSGADATADSGADATADGDVATTRAPGRTLEVLTALGATPCDVDASFLCGAVDMPKDHAHPDGPTLRWAFAVRPADTSPPKGLLVTIVGGPGDAGTEALDDYSSVGERFKDEFDLAYFDLRGMGGSGDFHCDDALTALYDGGMHVDSAATQADLVARATTFSPACLAEMGLAAGDAALYSTAQGAEDLEWLRATLEHPSMRIYGLSYGTQLGQIYAHLHPDRVSALVIDGVVDLTTSVTEFDAALARGVNSLLDRTLAVCDAEPDCSDALGQTAARAWDDAAALLPMDLDYSAGGEDYTTTLEPGALDVVADCYLDNADDRRALLDLLVGVVADDDWESMRQAYFDCEGLDDDGSQLAPDETLGAYYLITCADFGQPDQTAYLAAGHDFWRARVSSAFYGDIPCLTWPVAVGSSPSVATLDVPLLIVNADGDDATPHEQGAAVAARNTAAGVIEVSGGEHVMYGYGNTCVDDAVNAFLLDGTLPATRPLRCDDVFVSEP
ncbi:MAG: alpha/beta fold hydrolase [Myxococcota bacterium]